MARDHHADNEMPKQPSQNGMLLAVSALLVAFVAICIVGMIAHGEGAAVLGIVPILIVVIGCVLLGIVAVFVWVNVIRRNR